MRKLALALCLISIGGIFWMGARFPAPPSLPRPMALVARPSMPAARPVAALSSMQRPQAASHSALPPEPVAAFAGWLERYRLGSATSRASLLKEGASLAQQRQDALYALIAKDPAAALAASVDERMRRMLPPDILTLLERPLSAQGDLVAIASEPGPGAPDTPAVYHETHIDGQNYRAYVYGRRENQQTKYNTSLIGIVMQDRMAVLEEPARILSLDALPAGAHLEPPLAGPSPAGEAAGGDHIVQVAGRYYPVASGAQAAAVAARWVAAESHPGPILQANGTSLPGAQFASPQLSASHLLGPQSVLVILTSFTDATSLMDTTTTPSTPITSDYVKNRLTIDVADFYTQASYGQATIGNVDVTSVLAIPKALATYTTANDTSGLQLDAEAAARTAGFVLENYNRVIVVFPDSHSIVGGQFTWSGLAELGGSFAWINGNFDLGVVAHELGHNFGLSHARLWQIPVTSTDPVDPLATSLDYGDVFDIMGHAPSDPVTQPDPPNPWYLNKLGWLPDTAVQTVTTGGTFRVYRFDHQDATLTHPLALRLNRNEGTDYWLSFRRKYLGDPDYGNVSNGAYIFWALNGNPSSQLIDINAELGGNTSHMVAKDAALANGQTFNDTAAGISFQVMDIGGTTPDEYMDIAITYQNRIAFEHRTYTVDEQSGTATLVVQRSNQGTGAITVQYTTVPGTALSPLNYTTTSGTLTWADGDMTPRTITVPLIANSLTSATASFTVELSSPIGSPWVFQGGKVATVNMVQPGAADPLFVHPLLTRSINSLALQPDGGLVIGGNFDNTTLPVTSNGISRLLPTGTLDTSFDQGPGVPLNNLQVTVVARQPNGKILVGGNFTSLRGVAHNYLARLQPNGSLDGTFDVGTGPGNNADPNFFMVNTITVRPDGKILVGGGFTTWNGVSNKALVCLNEDGTLDSTFTHFDSVVQFFAGSEYASSIALQPSTIAPYFAIVVGGNFHRTFSSGGFHSGIIRLKADGTRDTTFDAPMGAHIGKATATLSTVTTVAAQIDGKILAAGQFTGFNGVAVNGLVRLNSTGTNDSAFVTKLGAGLTTTSGFLDVYGLYAQPDGKILAAGYFEKAATLAKSDIARFNADGTLDGSFTATLEVSPDGDGINAMTVGPDNGIFIALNNHGTNPLALKHLFSGLAAQAGVLQFSTPGTSVAKGDDAVVTVQRVGGTFGPVSVNYHTVARSAVAGTNYTVANGTLTWAGGDAAPKQITVHTMLTASTGFDKVFEIDLGIPMGGASLGQAAVAGVTLVDTDPNLIPKINFATTSATFTESVATKTVTVQLSAAHGGPTVIPFVVSGSAVLGKAYTVSSSPLTIGAGQTSADITISLKEDTVVEPNRSIIIDVQTPISGGAVLGTDTRFTGTLVDDDIPPSFTTSPAAALVKIGDGASFNSVPTGNPSPTVYWNKNKVKISPAVTSLNYPLSNIQLTHGGQYSVTATNLYGSATAIAELGVVDPTPKIYNVKSGTTATLTATTAGNLLTYTWSKAGGALGGSPRITTSGKSLIIKTVSAATDADVYTCTVSSPGTTPIPVLMTLNVIEHPPTITNTGVMDPGIVSGSYTYAITVNGAANITPSSYSASGLPAGLTCNATTGVISGKPTAATKTGPVNVTLKATNSQGTGTFATTLLISDLPSGAVGSYVAPIDRDAGVNGNLGGRFDLTVTGTGAFSGSLTLGASAACAFKGVLNTTVGQTTATGDVMVTLTKTTTAHVTFTIETLSSRITLGSVTAGGATKSFTGWRNTTPLSTYAGYQTFSMKTDDGLATDDSVPHGLGYGSFTIATATTFSVAGVLADGTAYTSSSSLGSLGDVLVYQAIYTGIKGSILGTLKVLPGTVALNADSTLSGTLTWSRPNVGGRTYGLGFGPLNLTAEGGRYLAPKSTEVPAGFVLGANNATLTFTSAHVEDGTPNPNLAAFTIKPGGGTTVPVNTANATVTFAPGTGAFNGGFSQTSPTARAGTYKGMLVNHLGTLTGDGWFTLPQLPTPTTSAILSGKVLLGKQ